MITETLGRSLASYDSGAARAAQFREDVWTGKRDTSLADELAKLTEIGRPWTAAERGFLDYVEGWLTA